MSLNKAQLTSLLANLQERVQLCESFDKTKEINAYCDELESQVTRDFKAAITHWNHNYQEMLEEIDQYRRALLSNNVLLSLCHCVEDSGEEEPQDFGMSFNPVQVARTEEELKSLTQKVQELTTKVTDHFESKSASQRFTKKYIDGFAQEAQEYLDRCKAAQTSQKALAFRNQLISPDPTEPTELILKIQNEKVMEKYF